MASCFAGDLGLSQILMLKRLAADPLADRPRALPMPSLSLTAILDKRDAGNSESSPPGSLSA
jgi:hypothetical protein